MTRRWSVVTATVAAFLLAGGAAVAPAGNAPTGKELFTTYKCHSCHTVAVEKIEKWKASPADLAKAKGTAVRPGVTAKPASTDAASATTKKAGDLSGVGAKKDAAWLARYLMKEEKLDEKLHKTVKFKGTPAELQTLSAWLGSLKTPVKDAAATGK